MVCLSKEGVSLSYDTDARASLLLGDSFSIMRSIPDKTFDLVVTSPPYNIGKSYETAASLDSYLEGQKSMIRECVRLLKPGGNICWQVGWTKVGNELLPLDFLIIPIFRELGLTLKNRVIWTFGSGLHARKRFSGRHETILWFTVDSSEGYFDLDAVRVPQKYPDKRHYKGLNKGELSGNPLGKNPGDVWDIPNVKSHHVEKTLHECQFPVALVQRLIRALSPKDGIVFDPYSGVATTSCAAVLESRRSVGIELDSNYHEIGANRINSALRGSLRFRALEKAIQTPRRYGETLPLREEPTKASANE